MPNPTTNPTIDDIENARIRNSSRGSTGSRARRAETTHPASIATAATASPAITGSRHG
jgi:hypothetical protein